MQLIKGQFHSNEAMDLLTQLIQVKIRFHENKIVQDSSEEEIKMRETRIKQLQNDLLHIRNSVSLKNTFLNIESNISLIF